MKRWVRKTTTTGVLALLLCWLPIQVSQARDSIDVNMLGPQIGEVVPEFNLPDQNGQYWTRDSILGAKGAILLFHRSADW